MRCEAFAFNLCFGNVTLCETWIFPQTVGKIEEKVLFLIVYKRVFQELQERTLVSIFVCRNFDKLQLLVVSKNEVKMELFDLKSSSKNN